jgi:hypothetical protein
MRRIVFCFCLMMACGPLYGQRNDRATQNGGLNRPERASSDLSGRLLDHGGLQGSLSNSRVYEHDLSQMSPRSAVGQELSGHSGREMSALAQERKLERRELRESTRGPAANAAPETASGHPGHTYPENSRRSPEHFTGHDRALQVQLAAVDRMRDRAIETGDADLLARADEFEARIRARFEAPIATPVQAPMDPIVPDPVLAPDPPLDPILPPIDPITGPTDPAALSTDPVGSGQ